MIKYKLSYENVEYNDTHDANEYISGYRVKKYTDAIVLYILQFLFVV